MYCDDKSISVQCVVSTSTSPVYNTMCQVYITSLSCTCVSVGFAIASADIPLARTSADTRGRCVLRGHRFLRCFSHPGPQDFTGPQPDVRLPGCLRFVLNSQTASSGDLDHVHAQAEHCHENHRWIHMKAVDHDVVRDMIAIGDGRPI